MLGLDLDTEIMTICLPARTIDEVKEIVKDWSAGRRTATVREVLMLAGKLHDEAHGLGPGWYFERWLLQPSKLHVNGQYKGEGGAWRGGKKRVEARRVLDLTEMFMRDMEWWRWCLKEGLSGRG